jgi:hypothetical protein
MVVVLEDFLFLLESFFIYNLNETSKETKSERGSSFTFKPFLTCEPVSKGGAGGNLVNLHNLRPNHGHDGVGGCAAPVQRVFRMSSLHLFGARFKTLDCFCFSRNFD